MGHYFFRVTKKYWRLLLSFIRASLISELAYRVNLASRFFSDILWYAAQLSIFEVLYRYTVTVNGWNHEETRAFMGILFLSDAIYMFLFAENLDRLGQKIRRGDLDLLLVKPVNSQFMLSLQKISVAYLGNIIFSTLWLIWAARQTSHFALANSFWLLLTIPMGVIISYSIRFITAATALYFTRSDAINYIWYQLYRLGTRPDSFYPTALRFFVLFVLPIGFLASVPASVILNKTTPLMLIPGGFLAATCLYLSSVFWKRGLRAYSSASS